VAPEKVIYPLEHAYSPAELEFGKLTGVDAAVAALLKSATPQADCDFIWPSSRLERAVQRNTRDLTDAATAARRKTTEAGVRRSDRGTVAMVTRSTTTPATGAT